MLSQERMSGQLKGQEYVSRMFRGASRVFRL
jgi:hypothetical protein